METKIEMGLDMPEYTHCFEFRVLNSRDFVSLDEEYQGEGFQRKVNNDEVQAIVANFDPRKINEPKISYREGKYHLLDGQHTVTALEIMAGGVHTDILCKVFKDMTLKEEALYYADQKGEATNLTSGDKMKAMLVAEDEATVAFKKANNALGITLELNGSSSDRHLSCLSTAIHHFKKYGTVIYMEAMDIILRAWGGQKESLRADIITALIDFVRMYKGEYDRDLLINKLHNTDIDDLWLNIKRGFDLPESKRGINQIYTIYNGHGKRKKLPLKF